MKTKQAIWAAMAALLAAGGICPAESWVVPGNQEKRARQDALCDAGKDQEAWYESHVLASFEDLLLLALNPGMPENHGMYPGPLAEVRARVRQAIEQYPDEVNDMSCLDGQYATPLMYAIACNDAELTRLLLEKGAVPLGVYPNSSVIRDAFSTWGGVREEGLDPRIARMVELASTSYSPVQLALRDERNRRFSIADYNRMGLQSFDKEEARQKEKESGGGK